MSEPVPLHLEHDLATGVVQVLNAPEKTKIEFALVHDYRHRWLTKDGNVITVSGENRLLVYAVRSFDRAFGGLYNCELLLEGVNDDRTLGKNLAAGA